MPASSISDASAAASGGACEWAALDDPGEWQGFSRAAAGREGRWESYLAIEGMHCAACSLTVAPAHQFSFAVPVDALATLSR